MVAVRAEEGSEDVPDESAEEREALLDGVEAVPGSDEVGDPDLEDVGADVNVSVLVTGTTEVPPDNDAAELLL